LQGTGNWLHGHWGTNGTSGGNGLAFYEKWVTPNAGTAQLATWVNMVGSNTGNTPDNVMYNNSSIGLNSGGAGLKQMAINAIGTYGSSESSDFEFSQLLIWDVPLTTAQMQIVSAALENYLTTGVLQ
jgi:hypothetical protein